MASKADDRTEKLARSKARFQAEASRVRKLIARDKPKPLPKGKRRRKKDEEPVIEATPERLAKGDDFEFVNPALIDSAQTIGLTRRFKATHLDRLYRKDDPDKSKLTYRQWAAGDWYRNQYARCRIALTVVAAYGERTTGGENSYGLPRTEGQAQARQLWRQARMSMPAHMVGFMDRFLIHDEMPRYGGSASMRNVAQIAGALDRLATWLKLN